MLRLRYLALAALFGFAGLPSAAERPPACEPGCVLVEEVVWQEVVRKVCKAVPDVKKQRKTVYDVKEESYCLPACPSPFGCGARGGAAQAAPRTRRILVKKEVVVEEPTVKYVVEDVVERVPCKVWRQVPCPPPTVGPGQ